MKRVTFRGVGVFADGRQINRVTAFGSSGTYTREQIFEMGHGEVIDVAEDIDEVSMTIDTNEHGTIDTHLFLAGKATGSKVNFSTDYEFARVGIWNYASGMSGTVEKMHVELMQNAVLTGYSLNYSVDGNATESFTLAADNKTWFANVEDHLIVPLYNDTGSTWKNELPSGSNGTAVVHVVMNGIKLAPSAYTGTVNDDTVVVNINNAPSDASVHALVKVAAGKGMKFKPDTTKAAVKRRGHVELYLVKNYTNSGGEIAYTENDLFKIEKAQTVSVDATLNREDIAQLGNYHYYYRPLVVPIEVSVNFDVIFGDLELWKQFTGAEDDAFTMSSFSNNLGLVIRVFDELDTKPDRAVIKEIHVPKLIPADENWNVSLDGQATQSFSFRASELAVLKL